MNNMLLLGMLGVILLVGVGMLLYISTASKKRTGLDQEDFRRRWGKIESLQSQGEIGWQLAIIEADKLLDNALKLAGHPGETMADRLKGARGVFSDTDGIWQAHKLRNRLAHEQDIRLNQIAVSQSLRHIKSALRDLGAL